ncbi:hypothetical protein GCM10010145_69680 [Streptomyces ruber]|uniref:Transposase IS110-like N-terminal domain-containing protein n=2 Tax=Streptomyces TaxID=1883 RepID=A0A918BT03_9ACTN|nr:hypothetical protein GCM10010145_69680 [Streptomyces ruber]
MALDAHGTRLLSRRVRNDEAELLQLPRDVYALTGHGEVLCAMDTTHGSAALLIGLLLARGQPMACLTGLAVHHVAAGYRGQGKTDARDARVIADQARMRRDLGLLRPGDEVAIDLRTLIGRRTDLVSDRTRQLNRLHAQLLEIFPAFERALTPKGRGLITLLTGYQTPAAITAAWRAPGAHHLARARHARALGPAGACAGAVKKNL